MGTRSELLDSDYVSDLVSAYSNIEILSHDSEPSDGWVVVDRRNSLDRSCVQIYYDDPRALLRQGEGRELSRCMLGLRAIRDVITHHQRRDRLSPCADRRAAAYLLLVSDASNVAHPHHGQRGHRIHTSAHANRLHSAQQTPLHDQRRRGIIAAAWLSRRGNDCAR